MVPSFVQWWWRLWWCCRPCLKLWRFYFVYDVTVGYVVGYVRLCWTAFTYPCCICICWRGFFPNAQHFILVCAVPLYSCRSTIGKVDPGPPHLCSVFSLLNVADFCESAALFLMFPCRPLQFNTLLCLVSVWFLCLAAKQIALCGQIKLKVWLAAAADTPKQYLGLVR